MENKQTFCCYSYKLNKFLKLIGFHLLEQGRQKETNKNIWVFDNPDDEKLAMALKYWKELRSDFNIN